MFLNLWKCLNELLLRESFNLFHEGYFDIFVVSPTDQLLDERLDLYSVGEDLVGLRRGFHCVDKEDAVVCG